VPPLVGEDAEAAAHDAAEARENAQNQGPLPQVKIWMLMMHL